MTSRAGRCIIIDFMDTRKKSRRRKVVGRAILRAAIKRHPDSQTKIAVECGMDPAKLSRIVNGLALVVSDADKAALARHLKSTPAKLFPRG